MSNLEGLMASVLLPEDIDYSVDEGTVDVGTDVDVSAETDTASQTEVAPSETNVLDLEQYGNHMVSVKRNGETVTVPLSEAIADGLRQADYTRKTQETAELRKQADAFAVLQQKLSSNPQEVIEALQRQFAGQQAPVADTTPVDPQYAALQNQISYLAQAEADRQLDATISRLQASYGEAFNADEVVSAAINAGVADAAGLESFFKMTQFDRLFANQAAAADFAATQAADDAARQAAAGAASGAISGGTSVTSGGTPPAVYDSIEASFAAAESALGIKWPD